jgi:hypothetical protein
MRVRLPPRKKRPAALPALSGDLVEAASVFPRFMPSHKESKSQYETDTYVIKLYQLEL